MTRKRFVKLLMARGYTRDEANARAWEVVEAGVSYEMEYNKIVIAGRILDANPDFVANLQSAIEAFVADLPKLVESISRFVEACTKIITASNCTLLEETLQDRQT